MIPPGPEPAGGGVHVEHLEGGTLRRLVLGGPMGNIIGLDTIDALCGCFEEAGSARALKAIVIQGAGHHFSFGASVPEHLPGICERMIPAFGRLFRIMVRSSVITLAAVHGRCLGGGLELAAICHRIFASPGATFGQPEITLGVFPPVASILLSDRVGRGRAEDICLSGRILGSEEACRIGLVDEIAGDPIAAAMDYARQHLLPRSASSLRIAARALRLDIAQRLDQQLPAVERLYLADLMATHDASEGIRSFMEKRAPIWKDA